MLKEQLRNSQLSNSYGHYDIHLQKAGNPHGFDYSNHDQEARIQQHGVDPRESQNSFAHHPQQPIYHGEPLPHHERHPAMDLDEFYRCSVGYKMGQKGQGLDMQRFKHPLSEWHEAELRQHQAMKGFYDLQYRPGFQGKEVKDDQELDRTRDIKGDQFKKELKQRKETFRKEDKQRQPSSEESSDESESDSEEYIREGLHNRSHLNPRDFDTKYPEFAPHYPYHPYPPGMHIPTPLRHLGPPSPQPSPYHHCPQCAACPPNTPINMQSPFHPPHPANNHPHMPTPPHHPHDSPYHLGHMPHVPMPTAFDSSPFMYPSLAYSRYPPMDYPAGDKEKQKRIKKRRPRDESSSESESDNDREARRRRKDKMREEKIEKKEEKMDLERTEDDQKQKSFKK